MVKKLTKEQENEVCKLYSDPTVKIRDIASAYGISTSVVCKTAIKLGAQPRNPNKAGTHVKQKKTKICPRCKRHITVKDAIFCCFCGADIRSPKDLLIQRIAGAMSKVKFLPDGAREEVSQLFIDIKAELSKE